MSNNSVNNKTKGLHFEVGKTQRSNNRKQLLDLLMPAIQFAKSIGLEPALLEFHERDESGSKEIKLSILKKKEIPKPEDICLNTLKAKDLTYLSNKKYEIFRSTLNLKNYLPPLCDLRKKEADINKQFKKIISEKSNFFIFFSTQNPL